ncbi:unnamed protein product [Cuscuta epithymum]|uniref:Mei2-like C-terminal RNA recognition motif domain-containing protein n=1 Tax=Cuscuta epithymum TaxID=186058 RepID=A0AAV0FL05_9ASTE|nr:unnamed protein product [Cuscuta epithymum]
MSKLNPSAHEYFPSAISPPIVTYMPHMIYQNVRFPSPPAYAVSPPHAVGFFHSNPYSGYFDGGVAAIKKVARPVGGKGQISLKSFFLPPRLQGKCRSFSLPKKVVKTKIWKPVKAKSAAVRDAVSDGSSLSPVAGDTTVMIRNIPNQYRRGSFMKFLDRYCIENDLAYDFLYLPMDFKTDNNLGYAFVNFTTAVGAAKITELLKDYKWGIIRMESGIFTSKKICEISPAKIKGKDALVDHFQDSKFICRTTDYLPVKFSPPRNGWPGSSEPQTVGKLVGPFGYN